MTDTLLAISSPVFTVGDETAHPLARDCVRLVVDEGVEGLRTLEAQLVASGVGAAGPPQPMLHLDGGVVDLGTDLKVSVGPEQVLRTVFDGTVSALEVVLGDSAPPRLVVLAEDRLMRLRMTRRSRTYTQVSDADVLRTLAGEHGLEAEASVDGPTYDLLQQVNQSDLAFLRERARRLQADLWCDGKTLHLSDRGRRRGTKLTLVHGNELITARIGADLAHQRTEVSSSGYDAKRKEVIHARAGDDAIRAEAPPGRTGPQVLERALGKRAGHRVRDVPLTTAEATSWARAELLRRARAFVRVTGVTRGSPDLGVGSVLRLEQVGAPFEGDGYYVTRMTQVWDTQHGLRTHFEAERPTLNDPTGGA